MALTVSRHRISLLGQGGIEARQPDFADLRRSRPTDSSPRTPVSPGLSASASDLACPTQPSHGGCERPPCPPQTSYLPDSLPHFANPSDEVECMLVSSGWPGGLPALLASWMRSTAHASVQVWQKVQRRAIKLPHDPGIQRDTTRPAARREAWLGFPAAPAARRGRPMRNARASERYGLRGCVATVCMTPAGMVPYHCCQHKRGAAMRLSTRRLIG